MVVREARLCEQVAVESSGCIIRFRDCYAGGEWTKNVLACDPDVIGLVPLDDGVAIIVGLADATKTRPEVIPAKWACD